MSEPSAASSLPPLSWTRRDWEQRLGFPGGKFTHVNNVLCFLLAAALTVAFFLLISQLPQSMWTDMFTRRGLIPYAIVFFFAWSLVILWFKWLKLRLQRQALRYTVVPSEPDYVLSPSTVDQVMERIYEVVDDPKHFLLFNRIVVALSNLRNIGRVSDVDEILRSQAQQDESTVDNSYSLVGGFVWAVPVLGFIGTVLGLSQAIGGFSGVLQASEDVSQIKQALQGVTAGLATAFETTLQGLVAALFIQLLIVFLRKSEYQFLDDCAEYCTRNVVNKLRVTPYEDESDEVPAGLSSRPPLGPASAP